MDHTLKEYLYEFIADISMTGEIDRFSSSQNDSVLFSPGVEQVADISHAYWLINAIACYLTPEFLQPFIKDDARIGDMHLWKLTVADDLTALLEARVNAACEPFVRQTIQHTKFPLRSIDICAAFYGNYWTLYLPSEPSKQW